MSRILVTSNCQTFGLAATLTALFPQDVVQAHLSPVCPKEVSECDVLVYDVFNGPLEAVLNEIDRPAGAPKVIRFPSVRFTGFHPDLCYARDIKTGELTSYHYNSAVAVWAYNNGISPSDAETLFCDEVFSALGYYDVFDASTQMMRADFADTDIDFDSFFLRIKRSGCFMYSCNHPLVGVIVHLARLIASKIDETRADAENELGIADGLTSEIWPLYPQIAARHALSGGTYDWKISNVFIRGLRSYLDWTFERYQASGLAPGDLLPGLASGLAPIVYDRVLGAALKRGRQ